MNDILKLNEGFKVYLEASTHQMVSHIKDILSGKSVVYLVGKTESDTVAYFFEYEYDYLDIVCWATDRAGNLITDTIILPAPKNSKADAESKWNAFMPEEIWMKIADFHDNYEEDDFDDILDEYNKEKYELFEKWFCDCWSKAVKETGIKTDAYFSIHDTIFKTDLNTLEEIKEKEIEERYK